MNKYADILYPSAALAVYRKVLVGEWEEGDPEQVVDTIIYDWLNRLNNYDDYIVRLRNAIREDKRIAECTILRLNYAALLIEEVDEIVILTGRKSELPTYKTTEEPHVPSTRRRSILGYDQEINKTDKKATQFVDGRLVPLTEADKQNNYDLVNFNKNNDLVSHETAKDMTLCEIDVKANDFYAHREVIKQHKIGLPENKRAFIKKKIIELGFAFNEDVNDVYRRLNEYLRSDYETSIIARLAYLAVINGDDLRSKNTPLMLGG